MEKVKIGDICEILNGYAFKSEKYVSSGIRILRIANVQKGYIEDSTPVFYPEETLGLERYMLEEGDLLISLTGNVGRVTILKQEFLPAALNQRVACLKVKRKDVLKSFLFHFLNSGLFEKHCVQSSKGVAQKNMSTEWLKEYEIPLYPIEKQKEIVRILDNVGRIINGRKEQQYNLDNLIKSRFVEMFGLPVSNTKGWKTEQMGEIAPVVNYKGEFDDEVWLLNLDMVEAQTGRILDYLIVSEEEVGNSTCTFDTSNVLYSKLRPYLNKVVIPDGCGYATSELVPLQPVNTKINREYLAFMLRSDEFVNMINEKVAGAKMPRVSMDNFRKFDVPVPSMDLQEQFADFVKQIDKLKVEMQQSLNESQLLFDSLMQKYFD